MADYSIDVTLENKHDPDDKMLGDVLYQISWLVPAGQDRGYLTYRGLEVGHWQRKDY